MGSFPSDKSIFLKNKNKAKLLPTLQVNSAESGYADESYVEAYIYLSSTNKSGQSNSTDKRSRKQQATCRNYTVWLVRSPLIQ